MFYSTAVKNKIQHFKITLKSEGNLPAETVKGILKSEINPTDIKVGINSYKLFTNGRVLIKTSRIEEVYALDLDV